MAAGALFSTIERGSASGITRSTTLAIKSEDEWHRIWAQHVSVRAPMPSPPQIDFSREMVIAVFAGERTTGGFTVEVTAIEHSTGAIRVTYRESGPPPDSLLAQAITQPYHIVTTPRLERPIVFERQ
jgi:hypothetical protein